MEVGNFGRLVRWKIFRGQIGRQIWEVSYVENFLRSERSSNLGG
jgi:hypothetical protein